MDDYNNNVITENEQFVSSPDEKPETPETVTEEENDTSYEEFLEPGANDEEPDDGKSKKKKPAIILGSVGGALILVIICLIILKGPIFYRVALNYIGNHNYETAEKFIKLSGGDKAEVLSEYISMRVDFNSEYKNMLTDFDEDKITEWYDTASDIKSKYDILPDDIRAEADDFQSRLGIIKDSLAVYANMRYDIIDMMEIFTEINRIIAKDENGERTTFTISEELEKVSRWQTICDNLNTFSKNAPNGDTVYLLIYLINETYGECSEIKGQMQNLTDAGYGADDEITPTGEGEEKFPSITNSNGVTLNVNDPETYESYMFTDLCTAMMRYMAACYYA